MTHLRPVPDNDAVEVYESDTLNDEDPTGFQARSTRVAAEFRQEARNWLESAGAIWEREHHMIGSYNVEGIIVGDSGQQFIVLVHAYSTTTDKPDSDEATPSRRPDSTPTKYDAFSSCPSYW